ncbi:MAG: hypothetical protein FJ095_00655 [Deltaproteobacteria bacterium]|nr:hypothetical protein [Deltaproteobacteria bacterium]
MNARVLALLGLVVLAACGGEPTSSNDASTAGPSSGVGGSPVPEPSSAKPVCANPESAVGPIPSARADVAGALSPDGRELVLFGGDEAIVVCGDAPKRAHVGDTWILDTACGGFAEVKAGVAPSPRARHSMASDPTRGRALLFGGRHRASGATGSYTLYGDVWSFDFVSRAWTELQTTGEAPSPRSNSAAIVAGDTLWVFGGSTSASGLSFTPKNDLHALDLETGVWRRVTPAGDLPESRLFHAFALDAARGRAFVAFGGDENAFVGPFFTDLYALDLATATFTRLDAKLPAGHGFGRIKLGLAARSGEGAEPVRLLAFGGHDDVNGGSALGNRNDVLGLDLPATGELATLGAVEWQVLRPGDTFQKPPKAQCDFPADFVTPEQMGVERRSAFAFAPTTKGDAFVVFGGDSDCGRLSDAWWYDTRTNAWTPIVESLPGLTCLRTGNPSCKSLCG